MNQRILIVYYSLTGNTKLVADEIARELNADIEPLKPIKELNPESRMRYFWGGFQANMKRKPKLESIKYNPLEYDIIILGTPIWSWTFSPPTRSYLAKFNLAGKRLALFCCCAGDGTNAMGKFRNHLKNSTILSEKIFQEPLTHGVEAAKETARTWVKNILKV